MTTKKRKLLLIGILILVILLGYGIAKHYGLSLPPIDDIKLWVASFGIWAPVIYILIYITATITFAPAAPLTLASGALFGFVTGTLLTVVGATIGAIIAFLIARKLGGGSLSKLKTGKLASIGKYEEKLEENAIGSMLFLRFVPLFPFNGLNFALGLTNVTLKDYAITTFFGIIPGTAAYVYFGESLSTLNPWKIALSIGLLVLLSVVAGKLTKTSK